MSAVWRYFKINNEDDTSRAKCKCCFIVKRRKEITLINTTNFIKHLKTQHSTDFKEYANASNARPQKQLTLQQRLEKLNEMSRDSLWAEENKGSCVNLELIALNKQPLLVIG